MKTQYILEGYVPFSPELVSWFKSQSPERPIESESDAENTLKNGIRPSRSRGKPISALWGIIPNKLPHITISEGERCSFDGNEIIQPASVISITQNSTPSEKKHSLKSTPNGKKNSNNSHD